MTQKFWVNNYFIDVTRNQIQHQQQATQLPPKALKVLEVLASRAGEVVSHDELMDLVWQQSVVGPNTLQRAIAQLRKAFGDDSKQQAFIKTHAKQGYSLEANVRWEAAKTEETKAEFEETKSLQVEGSEQNISSKAYWQYSALAILLLFSVWQVLQPDPELFNRVTPLTASDEQEFNASYSPDGRYLVFNRYVGQCVSDLWAKDLLNNQEVRLLEESGHYSSLSWSADGTQISFVLQSSCEDVLETNKQCWQLQTLDFAQAWNGEPSSLTRFDCAETETTKPMWLNDGRIVMLQHVSNRSREPQIVVHDSRSEQAQTLEVDNEGRIYSLDYSRAKNILASVSLTKDNRHILTTFNLDGKIIKQSVINKLSHHSVYEDFPISFTPDGEKFLTEVRGQIYHLDLNGNITLAHAAHLNGLSNATFHPSENKIAANQGSKDFDVGVLKINNESSDIEVFSRSTAVDINSQFQPNGELIAYVSYRSGNSQLWIQDGDRTYQLTHFERGTLGILFSWSPDGQRLVVNVNNKLALVNLDGSHELLDTPIAIDVLMPWTDPNKLLVTASQTEKSQLFSVDINSRETTNLAINNVLWAVYTNDNQIVYSDNQKKFWQLSQNDKKLLAELDGRLYGKRALFNNGHIYGIDGNDEFWRYELQTGDLTTITKLNKDIIYVSSLKSEQFLASKFMGGRRELVELSFAND